MVGLGGVEDIAMGDPRGVEVVVYMDQVTIALYRWVIPATRGLRWVEMRWVWNRLESPKFRSFFRATAGLCALLRLGDNNHSLERVSQESESK